MRTKPDAAAYARLAIRAGAWVGGLIVVLAAPTIAAWSNQPTGLVTMAAVILAWWWVWLWHAITEGLHSPGPAPHAAEVSRPARRDTSGTALVGNVAGTSAEGPSW